MLDSVKRSGDANERWPWHGTGCTPPATVLEHEVGPDPRFSKGGFYGPGLYLAEKARYSNDDRYVHQVPAGTLGRHRAYRQLLLCRAGLGVSFDFGEIVHKDLKKPPEESAGVLYDSVRGGPHQPGIAGAGDNDSPMFVLYDLAQAYPEYVVTFRGPHVCLFSSALQGAWFGAYWTCWRRRHECTLGISQQCSKRRTLQLRGALARAAVATAGSCVMARMVRERSRADFAFPSGLRVVMAWL
jgi:hypothetical protein